MLKAKDYRAKAREALKGKWKHASIAGLIAGVLGASILYKGYAGGSAESAVTDGTLENFSLELIIGVVAIFAVVALVMIFIGSLVGLGYAKFNLSLFEEETADFKMVFSERKRYKDCFALYVMQFVIISIGSLLFAVPGIIAFYAFCMAPYIMVENPDMSAKQAMKESRAMMKGNKWKLFCLSFSFIGWDLLAALTFGVGHIVLCPYVEAAGAAFYRELKANN
jgi:uncharacterized membrane protein